MRCTCATWINKMKVNKNVYVRGEIITYCPFCGLTLVKDKFKVYLTYDGPGDENKDEAIEIMLASFDIKKMPDTNTLFVELSLL